jgi:hypothetical protein
MAFEKYHGGQESWCPYCIGLGIFIGWTLGMVALWVLL